MAQNLQVLKRRIKTAKNIAQIAKAMEMIAASKIKRAQAAVISNKPYANAILTQTQKLLSSIDQKKITHPYLRKNTADKKLLIILAPDKGLSGSLVTTMARKLYEMDLSNTYIITLSKKLERVVIRTKAELIASFPFGTGLPSYSRVYPLIKLIEEYYVGEKVKTVELFYPEFESIFAQKPHVSQILPITYTKDETLITTESPYIFEPSIVEILEALLPYYLEVALYSALIESHTSEQAARMVAMQNAKNNALDIADSLKLAYNKSRQEKITSELLDLANGQLTS
jgi:F-type H+-transporting ATPase subunit gamma